MRFIYKKFIYVIAITFICDDVKAQEVKQDKPDITWGKVIPEDFNLSMYKVDTSRGAVIIADIGSSSFKGNTKGWFTLVYKKQTRIKITNKNGLDLANLKVSLYHSDKLKGVESLDDIKVSTYNLVNGQVIENKLPKNSILTEELDKNHTEKKLAIVNVKEGSIIEYSYTITSDFTFNLQPWSFQGKYPRIWSEYSVDIPNFFEYVFLTHGFNPIYIRKTSTHTMSYRVLEIANNITSNNEPESYQIGSINTLNRWVMKDVPGIQREKYITSMNNYYSRIEFQLSAYNFRGQPYEPKLQNWVQTSSDLMNDEDRFGLDLKRETGFFNEALKTIKSSSENDLDLAKGIYNYIRDHFSWNEQYGLFLSRPLKESYQKREGNIADVNMLLVAMLRQGKLDAHPFILSTRDNGKTTPKYPLLDEYNYVLAQVNIQGKSYLLDASRNPLGFGQLPAEVYNDQGMVISDKPVSISLSPDSIREVQYSSVILTNDEKSPKVWNGLFNQQFSVFNSLYERNGLLKNGLDNYKKDRIEFYKNSRTGIEEIDSFQIQNPKDPDQPLKESFYFKIKPNQESSLLYITPVWNLDEPSNPFKSEERKYPVELNSLVDLIYTFQMDIPVGYKVEELPKSARVNLNEKEGSFEYIISQEDNIINMKSRLKINKSIFLPEDYSNLRKFYDFIYKKSTEPIVFKKL